ncbi:hypothetical protein QLX08_000489 [Tetragonisca angustula]|uniref:Uncharacterized protein n=1 Tax=Tetragonisca angustula TaxID=166442 RepID=A0AAW1AJN8_9HYME
MTLDLRRSLSV